MRLLLCLSSLVLFCSPSAWCSPAQNLYQEAVGLYQGQKWQEAATKFSEALKEEPNNPFILYNLGLTKFQLQETGYALALWRKALSADPYFGEAKRALKMLEEKTGGKNSQNEQNWAFYQLRALAVYFGLPLLGLTLLILFCVSIWLWLGFIGKYARARESQSPTPPFPLRAVMFTMFALLVALLTSLEALQISTPSATVVAKEMKVKSAPDEKGTDLFNITEGTEVLLKASSGNWVQATLPGGLTGWIDKQGILQTSGKPLL